MKHLLIFALLSLLVVSKSNAEVIKDYTVNGNKRISDETIKIYGKIELNKDYIRVSNIGLLKSPQFLSGFNNNIYNNTNDFFNT